MSIVSPVRQAAVCRLCRRELETRVSNRVSGHVQITMVCPKHGTLGKGERYMVGYVTAQEEGATQ